MSTLNQKYRPYFSAAELLEIIHTFKQHPTPARMGIIKYLEGYLVKINHGIITPAHVPVLTAIQKLGFDPVLESMPTKTQIMQAAWEKVSLNPSAATPAEIELCMEYKYVHDLMTPKEMKDYEAANGFVS